jgi:hypothetical protein
MVASALALAIVIGVTVFRIGTGGGQLDPSKLTPPVKMVSDTPVPAPQEARVPEVTKPAAVAEVAPAVAVTPKKVHFVVSTEPRGATVSIDGRNLGKTPVEFHLESNEEGIATAQLILSLEGYERTTVTASGSGPEVVLTQQLQRKARRKAATSSLGYKDDPYQ